MADSEWLKHLAGARGAGKALAPADPVAVQRLAAGRVAEAIHLLYEEAQEACLVFNEHAQQIRGARPVNLLALASRKGSTAAGFMLMMGGAQVTLEVKEPPSGLALEATLVNVGGFIRSAKTLHRFLPQIDPFGSLAWMMDNALLMTNELIIKRLLEDLARAALPNTHASSP